MLTDSGSQERFVGHIYSSCHIQTKPSLVDALSSSACSIPVEPRKFVIYLSGHSGTEYFN